MMSLHLPSQSPSTVISAKCNFMEIFPLLIILILVVSMVKRAFTYYPKVGDVWKSEHINPFTNPDYLVVIEIRKGWIRYKQVNTNEYFETWTEKFMRLYVIHSKSSK